MPLPSPVGHDSCALATKWLLDPDLADMLVRMDIFARVTMSEHGLPWPGLRIVSGQRSSSRNVAVGGAPRSLHTRCPSQAADLTIGRVREDIPADAIWRWLGSWWKLNGGRWGGDFETPDFNHFDLGVQVA